MIWGSHILAASLRPGYLYLGGRRLNGGRNNIYTIQGPSHTHEDSSRNLAVLRAKLLIRKS